MIRILSLFTKFTEAVVQQVFSSCNFTKKETLAQMFSCEFCEISKKTFFRAPAVAASEFKLAWESATPLVNIYTQPSNMQEPHHKSKVELLRKIVNGFQMLNILLKSSILDIWLGFECACTKYLSTRLFVDSHIFSTGVSKKVTRNIKLLHL